MSNKSHIKKAGLFGTCIVIVLLALALNLFAVNQAVCTEGPKLILKPSPASELPLKGLPFKIVYEIRRKTDGKENWELYLINADGSNPVNLTNTANVDEMYPHASSDGTKICFVVDEGAGRRKVRSIYYMNIDGTGRVKVADNARQPCWSPDGKTIAYLKGEFERYTIKDFATKGFFFYDIETGKHTEHPNKNMHHLYNICWSPEGNWFLATVHGGMGFKHANLTFRANGTKVFDLTKYGVTGCRAEFGHDGKRITWGLTDWDLFVAMIDFSQGEPIVSDLRKLVRCEKDYFVFHTDFSPDGNYIAFSYGPSAGSGGHPAIVGCKAKGWNICVSDMTGKWVQITTDGNQNKEPDWVPIRPPNR